MIAVVGGRLLLRRPLAELADSGARRGLGNEPRSLTTGETPTWRNHVSAAWAWSKRPRSPVGVTGMATRRGLRSEGEASQCMEKAIPFGDGNLVRSKAAGSQRVNQLVNPSFLTMPQKGNAKRVKSSQVQSIGSRNKVEYEVVSE